MRSQSRRARTIAVIGTGVTGLSAAWLLAPSFDITVFESADRIGGHSNTVNVSTSGGDVAIDTGFIVYNERTYPNLTALFDYLGVITDATNMSFAASLRGGDCEYSGESLGRLFAQKRNLFSPRFWCMLYDLQRFYRTAPAALEKQGADTITLGHFVKAAGYSRAFIEDHLLPLSAAIWSAAPHAILDYPVAAFIRFHENHGLLRFIDRPIWRTVAGGSTRYVERLSAGFADRIVLDAGLQRVERSGEGVEIIDVAGHRRRFDHVIFATHADQALRLLGDPSSMEQRLLSAFRYATNEAYLHTDPALMPKRRRTWASWNFISGRGEDDGLTVTYWMNKLQRLGVEQDFFVTLNPTAAPREDMIHAVETYEHPQIDTAASHAQKQIWSLQGVDNTWFCGAYFGAGFHEDGLQAGLAVAEQLAASEGLAHVRRPWRVEGESGRIHLVDPATSSIERLAA